MGAYCPDFMVCSQKFAFLPENEAWHSGESQINMPLLQLPGTHESEEETFEPDLEGKYCLYQTEQCADFFLLKHSTIQKCCQNT